VYERETYLTLLRSKVDWAEALGHAPPENTCAEAMVTHAKHAMAFTIVGHIFEFSKFLWALRLKILWKLAYTFGPMGLLYLLKFLCNYR